MKFGQFVDIITKRGFSLVRQEGSHRQYRGVVGGRTHLVTVAGKNSQDILPKTLASMIRQSGLPKTLFRN